MTALEKSLSIRSLEAADSAALSAFMGAQPPEYSRFFYAFDPDESAIAKTLASSERDVYTGVFWQGNLVGVFMLRGWDAGYQIPSFGVLVDEKYRGGAFLRLTLDAAKLICRLSGTRTMMAKVHPDNATQRTITRLGFRQTGVEESTGNIIYHLEL